jgi:hypothetical protein
VVCDCGRKSFFRASLCILNTAPLSFTITQDQMLSIRALVYDSESGLGWWEKVWYDQQEYIYRVIQEDEVWYGRPEHDQYAMLTERSSHRTDTAMLNPSVARDGELEGQHTVDTLDFSSWGLHGMPQRVVLLVLWLVLVYYQGGLPRSLCRRRARERMEWQALNHILPRPSMLATTLRYPGRNVLVVKTDADRYWLRPR